MDIQQVGSLLCYIDFAEQQYNLVDNFWERVELKDTINVETGTG